MSFDSIKGKLGFGCMRLPMKDDEVDHDAFSALVDIFLAEGFNYFDTATGYLSGKSETALKKCLTDRYPRESYLLTNKLSTPFFEKNEDIRPYFQRQLDACGVEYFDFYLMHAQEKKLFEKYKACRAYETALEFLKEGRIKHFGISFHDNADMLKTILDAYPQIEVVQLQFNYLDYEDDAIQSRKCYELCRERNIPVFVMEPVKGGSLANLPDEAAEHFKRLGSASAASYAIRFAAGFEGVVSVLSGMGDEAMLRDNIASLKAFKPLDEKEREAVNNVVAYFKSLDLVSCTACRYCTDGCPANIPIPDVFSCYNKYNALEGWNSKYYYSVATHGKGKAKDCLKCGACEAICPQHLEIIKNLERASEAFDKKEDK